MNLMENLNKIVEKGEAEISRIENAIEMLKDGDQTSDIKAAVDNLENQLSYLKSYVSHVKDHIVKLSDLDARIVEGQSLVATELTSENLERLQKDLQARKDLELVIQSEEDLGNDLKALNKQRLVEVVKEEEVNELEATRLALAEANKKLAEAEKALAESKEATEAVEEATEAVEEANEAVEEANEEEKVVIVPEETDKVKIGKGTLVAALVATLIAGGILGYLIKDGAKINTKNINVKSETTTEELIEAAVFDAKDEKAVKEVAEEVMKSVKLNGLTEEQVETLIKWINGVADKDVDEMALMNEVNLFAEILNTNKDFDFSVMFADSTARKAAGQVYNVRKDIVTNLGTEKVNESADLMTELTVKLMYGLKDKENDKLNNIVDYKTIETAGERLFVTVANQGNYALADNDRWGKYEAINGQTYFSKELFESVSNTCDKDGMSLLTSMMYEAYYEALANQEALKLTK